MIRNRAQSSKKGTVKKQTQIMDENRRARRKLVQADRLPRILLNFKPRGH
jgi:hypothetical protein